VSAGGDRRKKVDPRKESVSTRQLIGGSWELRDT
jgi:hypothetical protein